MNATDILNTMSKTVTKIGFQLKKHSPEILVTGGIVGVIGSTVLACRATLKVNDVLDEAKGDIAHIHQTAAPVDEKKELAIAYVKTGARLVRLYLPALGLGALSISGIVGANKILNKRNAALAAAYATVDAGFKEYRGRVVNRFGEEVDKELRYNVHNEKIEETVVDEDGKTKKVKRTVQVTEINEVSDYARFFDADTSRAYASTPGYAETFLKFEQNYANNILAVDGYLFLNDVYDRLGIDRSVAGQMVGWVYDRHKEDETSEAGDNFVDFRMEKTFKRNANGELVPTIRLDFNVDGCIIDRAAEKNLIVK